MAHKNNWGRRQFILLLVDFPQCVTQNSIVGVRDLTNAFERVGAAKASEKYLVFVIKVEDDVIYIQAHICVQGLALSAYYFPVWWFRLMFRCFGYMFLLFIATYVDDNVIHGPTEDRVYYRNLMFESFCRIAEIEISEKRLLSSSQRLSELE